MKEIKRLDKSNRGEYKALNAAVMETLTDKAWFIPFSEEVSESMFDVDSTLVVYGCFVDGVLAAVSMFDSNKEEYAEVAEAAGMPMDKKGAELGGSMVLPAYRGQNLMWEINRALCGVAKDVGYDFLVATAHPENKASNASLQKLGFSHKNTITRSGVYLRNVYAMEL